MRILESVSGIFSSSRVLELPERLYRLNEVTRGSIQVTGFDFRFESSPRWRAYRKFLAHEAGEHSSKPLEFKMRRDFQGFRLVSDRAELH